MPTSNIIPKVSRSENSQSRPSRKSRCAGAPAVRQILYQFECPDCCEKEKKTKNPTQAKPEVPDKKPDNISIYSWQLKQQKYGAPPSKSEFRTAKFRWDEKNNAPEEQVCEEDCPEKKYINPFRTKDKTKFSAPGKRKIVETWGKMWDSALSDFQFDRMVFENNPDAEQTYRTDDERINDGCRKLCAIAKMNQNIITMMMKKFVSGPPSKLYTLNRLEAAECWTRIINEKGVVNDNCCVDLPSQPPMEFDIPALHTPRTVGKEKNVFKRMTMFQHPDPLDPIRSKKMGTCEDSMASQGTSSSKKNPTYWLDPKTVPPVPPGFREEEFQIEPKNDPTGKITRDLRKARIIAQRYTRFANIIEKAVHVIPNLDRVEQKMDEHFVAKDERVRRQTLLHHFFSSPKMETSPDFKKDALFATILSRDDNAKANVTKKPYPYSLAETSKSKSTYYLKQHV